MRLPLFFSFALCSILSSLAQGKDTLVLLPHNSGVVGWVVSEDSYAGAKVIMSATNSAAVSSATVIREGNTFAMHKPKVVGPDEKWTQFAVSVFSAGKPVLMQGVDLRDAPQPEGQAVFFVTDRSAYRAGQKLQFAGFLRKYTKKGDLVPAGPTLAEVSLRSIARNTLIYKKSLPVDTEGRFVGEYAFHAEDSLDDYALSVKDAFGQAKVKLASFRKTKVRLDISGELSENKGAMQLKLVGLDFANKPVVAKTYNYQVQVVTYQKPDVFSRKTTEFLGAGALDDFTSKLAKFRNKRTDDYASLYQLTDELYGFSDYYDFLRASKNTVVYNAPQQVTPPDAQSDGSATLNFPLQKKWCDGNHALFITASMIDENNRQKEATKLLPLPSLQKTETSTTDGIAIAMSKQVYTLGEKITVSAELNFAKADGLDIPLAAALLQMDPDFANQSWVSPYAGNYYRGSYQRNIFPQQLILNQRNFRPHLQISNSFYYPQRNFVGVQPPRTWTPNFIECKVTQGGQVTFTPKKAGVYQLVLSGAANSKGKQCEARRLVLVKPKDPAGVEKPVKLRLSLNKEEIRPDESLTLSIAAEGEVVTNQVLLTLEDAEGIKFLEQVTLKDNKKTITMGDVKFFTQLDYGCSVSVYAVGPTGELQTVSQPLRVYHPEKDLGVLVSHPEEVDPGKEVTLDLEVCNHAKQLLGEQVDLVVTVYDASLLGIEPDKTSKISSYFLANGRGMFASSTTYIRGLLGSTSPDAMRKFLAEKHLATFNKATKSNLEVAELPGGFPEDVKLNSAQLQMKREIVSLLQSGAHVRGQWLRAYFLARFGIEIVDPMSLLQRHSVEAGASLWERLARFNLYFDDGKLYLVGLAAKTLKERETNATNWKNWVANYHNGWGYGSQMYGSRMHRSRGDAHHSSANAFASAQSFISHAPATPAAPSVDISNSAGVASSAIRRDFSDSAFFNAKVRTDGNGKASVTFKLPDSLTNWQVVVTAVTKDLRIGHQTSNFKTYRPVMIWPMIPRNYTTGDEVNLFGRVFNYTKKPQEMTVKLVTKNGEVVNKSKLPTTQVVTVPPSSSETVYWTFTPGEPGFTELLMSVKCDAGEDASLKRLPVVSASNVTEVITLAGGCEKSHHITLPKEFFQSGEKSFVITYHPSSLTNLVETLDYLVQYPHGCVEQTMSKFLPAIKVAQILKTTGLEHPGLEAKLPTYAAAGIKRLLQLQKADGGWGWQSNSQTHEMMTPYALLGLLEAKRAGYDITDQAAVDRGLDRLGRFIDSLTSSKHVTDRLFCLYVYSLDRELKPAWWTWLDKTLAKDILESNSTKVSDYAVALALEIVLAAKDDPKYGSRAKELSKKFATALIESASGSETSGKYWTTANFSRWGNNKNEITAVVLQALVHYDCELPIIPAILHYLNKQKRGNKWTSTKDTALVLMAMCEHLAKLQEKALLSDKKNNVSNCVVEMSNYPIREANAPYVLFRKEFSIRATDDVSMQTKKISVPVDKLREGMNFIRFSSVDPTALFTIVAKYSIEKDDVKPFATDITTTRRFYLLKNFNPASQRWETQELKEGDTIPRGSYIMCQTSVQRKNYSRSSSDFRYVLVDSPKPSGMELVGKKDKRFAAYARNWGAQVFREAGTTSVFYHIEQLYSMNFNEIYHAELAGTFTVPPTKAEMMYEPETCSHTDTFQLTVE